MPLAFSIGLVPDRMATSGWPMAIVILTALVLISAAASLQTTIMPTARGTLAMAVYKALPARFASVNRFQAPSFSTLKLVVSPTDENTLEAPLRIVPQEQPLAGCSSKFKVTLPPNSVNLMRGAI